MRLKRIVLDNFKCHESLVVPVSGDVRITGPNGAGKTSVLEAITSALYGKDLYGGTGIGRFIGSHSDKALVGVDLDSVSIKRQIARVASTAFIDDEQVKVADVQALLPPVDIGTAMINPMVFVFNSDADKRRIFMSLLPKGDRREIFVEMFGEELADRFLKSTKGDVSSSIASCRTEILMTESRIQSNKFKLRDSQEKLRGIGDVAQEDVTRDYEETLQKITRIKSNIEKKNELQQELDDIKQRAGKLKGIYEFTDKPLVAGLEEKSQEYRTLLDKISRKIAQTKAKIEGYETIKTTGECPVCGTSVDKLTFPSLSEELDKLESVYEKLLGESEGIDTDLSGARSMLERTKRVREGIDAITVDETVLGRLEELLRQYKLKMADQGDSIALAEKKVLEENVKEFGKAVEEDEGRLKKLKAEAESLATLKEAFGRKGVEAVVARRQAQVLEGYFKNYFDDVKIKTVRPNKTSEGVKEVFDLFVDGVEFKNHSFGERLLIGVAMSLIIRELSKTKLDFILMDEVSILSADTRKTIQEWTSTIDVIYTDVADKFSIQHDGDFRIKTA